MGARRSRLWRIVGYPAFGLFSLALGLYLTFPYERLKTKLASTLEKATQHQVEIASLEPSWVTGLVLEGVTLTSRRTKPGEKPTVWAIQRAKVRVGLLPLLIGRTSVSFEASLLGGEIEGKLSRSSSETQAEWNADKLSLSQLVGPALSKVVSLPLIGTLSTSGELTIAEGKVGKAEGKITLACESCRLGDGKSKLSIPGDPFLSQGVTISKPIRLGKFGGDLVIKEGRAELKGLGGRSPDLELTLEGHVDLREPMSRSPVRGYLKFKFTEAIKKAVTVIDLLEKSPKLQRAKTSDGFYGIALTGTLGSLSPYPSRTPPVGMNTPRPGKGAPGARPGLLGRGGKPGFSPGQGRRPSTPPPRPGGLRSSLSSARPFAAPPSTAPSTSPSSAPSFRPPPPYDPTTGRRNPLAAARRLATSPRGGSGETRNEEERPAEEQKENEGGGGNGSEAPAEPEKGGGEAEAPAPQQAEEAAEPEVNDN